MSIHTAPVLQTWSSPRTPAESVTSAKVPLPWLWKSRFPPIPRDEDVRIPVAVVVADGDAHPEHRDVEPRLARHVGEPAVAVVVVERAGRGPPIAEGFHGQVVPLTKKRSGCPSLS